MVISGKVLGFTVIDKGESMIELGKAVFLGVVLLLPLANPLTAVAMFLGLAGNMPKSERDKTAFQSAFYTLLILLATWYAGNYIMHALGISIAGLRISGGMIVAFIGFTMLFPSNNSSDNTATGPARTSSSISFVPLAMPATAGPGTIALVVSTASTLHADQHVSKFVFLLAPPLVALIIAGALWLGLYFSNAIMRFLGEKGINAISRLMGFLLVCIGVQFVINGVLEIIQQYHG